MNILYLLFSFTTGGTERLVTDICNEMVHRGNHVHLYIVNDLYDESMLQQLHTDVQVQLQKRPVGGGKLTTLWEVARYIRRNRIDVVHCNSFNAPELLLLHPVYFPKVKILHTVHDVGQYEALSAPKRILRNHLCDRFIAISQCVKEDIIAHGATAKKVHTVYNAIDLTRFRFQPKEPGSDVFRIGNVARIMPEKKGQDVLLEAIALLHDKFPHIQCLFAGSADAAHQEAFAQLQASVAALGIQDHIQFLGNVEDVPSLLSTLDAFVLPSRYEGFGISLVEAMAMGIPCIASNLDGPAEVLEHGKLGLLFHTADPQALAGRITELIEHYPSYHSKATEQAPLIRKRYNIVSMCDSLEALYG